MTQAALPFDTADRASFNGTGFEIGWDHAHHRLTPPAEHLQPGNPVRQGWQAGQALFGARTLRATPQVHKWLQLRLAAWLRGRAFETVLVTPAFLKRIDVAQCPITREPLTHASAAPSDASVDRVNNRAGYAAGNLAVISVRANRAKADLGWDAAMARVRRIEAERRDGLDGLGAAEWSRLAVLMSLATPLRHAQAASLPLLVLPPPRLRLLNPVQALQALLTLQFTRTGYAQRIALLAALMPDAATKDALRIFMHTLLARRIAAGHAADPDRMRTALEDLWADPLVHQRWQRLALRLDEAGCERIVQLAERRGLAPAGMRWLPREAATDGWALDTRGHAVPTAPIGGGRAHGAPRVTPAATAATAARGSVASAAALCG